MTKRDRLPQMRPHAGRAPELAFYEALLNEYDRLVHSGSRDPAKQIAKRYDVQPGTVRTWLRRGRDYLGSSTARIPYTRHCRTCTCPESTTP